MSLPSDKNVINTKIFVIKSHNLVKKRHQTVSFSYKKSQIYGIIYTTKRRSSELELSNQYVYYIVKITKMKFQGKDARDGL